MLLKTWLAVEVTRSTGNEAVGRIGTLLRGGTGGGDTVELADEVLALDGLGPVW